MPLPKQPSAGDVQIKARELVNYQDRHTTQPSIQIPKTGSDGKPVTNNFPGMYIPKHSYDSEWAKKARLVRKNPYTGEPMKWQAEVDEKTIKYMKDKEDIENALNYEEFKMSLIDFKDPVQGKKGKAKGKGKAGGGGQKRKVEPSWPDTKKKDVKIKKKGKVTKLRGKALKAIKSRF